MIKVSAPGKLMLFGEHAVVYNRPCLVAAISQRLFVQAEKISENKILIDAPEMEIFDFPVSLADLDKEQSNEVRFVLEAIKNFFRKYQVESGLKIKTESQFLAKYGFGSSSAVTVCVVKVLSELFGIKMEKKEIFDLAYQTVLDIQGLGSGFDIAAAIYGGVIYFVTGGKIIKPLKVKDIPLLVGYTGVKASTSEIVKQVKAEMKKRPEYYENLYNQITQIVERAKVAMENSNWPEAGRLMSENQEILRKFKAPSKEYGVSSEIIEKLIGASLRAGAYGVKLSGAGVGDCIIALGEDKEKIAEASPHLPERSDERSKRTKFSSPTSPRWREARREMNEVQRTSPRPASQGSAIEKAISQAGGIPVSVDVDYQGLKIEKIW